jgi:hypothetical protein
VALLRCLKNLWQSFYGLRSALTVAERAGDLDSVARLNKLKTEISSVHKALQRRSRSYGRRVKAASEAKLLREVSALRTRDPRRMHQMINKIFPKNPAIYAEGEARPAMRPVYDHYRALWKETRTSVPALDSTEYDRYLPTAKHPELSAHLAKPFIRSDVYAACFAPAKSMLREYKPRFPEIRESTEGKNIYKVIFCCNRSCNRSSSPLFCVRNARRPPTLNPMLSSKQLSDGKTDRGGPMIVAY